MKRNDISEVFYSLNNADIQFVAQQELERNLNEDEVEKVKELAVSKINWYEVIANTIHELNME